MAAERGEQRKLAAILVADVVGYSRLAGADEDRVLARLRSLRSDLIDPAIAAHHGRIVKRTGDGAIIEFRSVVDAVRSAIEVQNSFHCEREIGFTGLSARWSRCPQHHAKGRVRTLPDTTQACIIHRRYFVVGWQGGLAACRTSCASGCSRSHFSNLTRLSFPTRKRDSMGFAQHFLRRRPRRRRHLQSNEASRLGYFDTVRG